MSKRYSIAEARAQLPKIIDEAQAGEAIEIVRRGKSVAMLISCGEFERLRRGRANFSDAYREFLTKYSLEEIGIEDIASTFPRDQQLGRKVSL